MRSIDRHGGVTPIEGPKRGTNPLLMGIAVLFCLAAMEVQWDPFHLIRMDAAAARRQASKESVAVLLRESRANIEALDRLSKRNDPVGSDATIALDHLRDALGK